MNHLKRLLLPVKLLVGFESAKMIIFAIAILILGEVFYQIDKRISDKDK